MIERERSGREGSKKMDEILRSPLKKHNDPGFYRIIIANEEHWSDWDLIRKNGQNFRFFLMLFPLGQGTPKYTLQF